MYKVAKQLLNTLPKKMIKIHQVIIGLIILIVSSSNFSAKLDSTYVTDSFLIIIERQSRALLLQWDPQIAQTGSQITLTGSFKNVWNGGSKT